MLVPWGSQSDLPEMDALLLHAHALYKAQKCVSCGRHVDKCHDPALADDWDVATDICYATAARQRWEQGEGRDAEPGTLAWVELPGESVQGRKRLSQAQMVAALNAAQTPAS